MKVMIFHYSIPVFMHIFTYFWIVGNQPRTLCTCVVYNSVSSLHIGFELSFRGSLKDSNLKRPCERPCYKDENSFYTRLRWTKQDRYTPPEVIDPVNKLQIFLFNELKKYGTVLITSLQII